MKIFDPQNRTDIQYDVHIPGFHRNKKDTADIMSIELWLEGVEDGSFIDYDGFGDGINEAGVTLQNVRPSTSDQISDEVEWVVWYNR
jgi:hypothetical protein